MALARGLPPKAKLPAKFSKKLSGRTRAASFHIFISAPDSLNRFHEVLEFRLLRFALRLAAQKLPPLVIITSIDRSTISPTYCISAPLSGSSG